MTSHRSYGDVYRTQTYIYIYIYFLFICKCHVEWFHELSLHIFLSLRNVVFFESLTVWGFCTCWPLRTTVRECDCNVWIPKQKTTWWTSMVSLCCALLQFVPLQTSPSNFLVFALEHCVYKSLSTIPSSMSSRAL